MSDKVFTDLMIIGAYISAIEFIKLDKHNAKRKPSFSDVKKILDDGRGCGERNKVSSLVVLTPEEEDDAIRKLLSEVDDLDHSVDSNYHMWVAQQLVDIQSRRRNNNASSSGAASRSGVSEYADEPAPAPAPAVVEPAVVAPAVVEPAVVAPALPAVVEPAVVAPALPVVVEPAVVAPALPAVVAPAVVARVREKQTNMGDLNRRKSHPKGHSRGPRTCRVCGNSHGVIRKYGLMCCRQCLRSYAEEIGFIKYR